ncbi:MAG TPA: Fic family protein [Treponemataceae bacterium]|jgi:Fic family protein|nr:Fic family protein [Treponemataceae bacterium]
MDFQKQLNELDKLKNELDSHRPLTPQQVSNLKRLFDIDFTYNSAAIEGNTYTLQETRIVLLDGITIGGKSTREHLEIVNHKEAIDYIELLSLKEPIEYTKSDILNIHTLVLKGIDTVNAGIYRKVPVYVRLKDGGTHKFCDPLIIHDEMDNFFNWLISPKSIHPVIFAAEVHTRFVSIHPFIDGNGRTARLLMNLILLHYGYPPSIIKVTDRAKYLDAIENWQQSSNKSVFIKMVIESVKESIETYLDTLNNNIIWK